MYSRGSSQPRDWTQVSWIAGRLLTIWASRKAQSNITGVLTERKIRAQSHMEGIVWRQGKGRWGKQRALRRNQSYWHLDLGLLASRLWENKFLLFKPPSLWSFVMAALSRIISTLSAPPYFFTDTQTCSLKLLLGVPGCSVKCNAGDTGDVSLIPGSGRVPGGGYGNPLQYPCLENPMDRGAWWAIIHGGAKSHARLSDLAGASMHARLPAGRSDAFSPYSGLQGGLHSFLCSPCLLSLHLFS